MKKTTFIIILLASFFLVTKPTLAQENFIEGFIINMQNDTIYGYIDYKNWNQNPDKIKFKDHIHANPSTYTPLSIRQFNVKGDSYLGVVIEYESSSTQLNQLEENDLLKLKTDTSFLQVLVEGEKSLYKYKSSENRDNYYIKNEYKPELLVYKKFLKDKNGINTISENTMYLGQLFSYLKDCESISTEFSELKYTENSLKHLFDTYYKCQGVENPYRKQSENIDFVFGPIIGYSSTKLSFSGPVFPDLTQATPESSTDLTYGLFFELVMPRNRRKISIYNEILLNSYQSELRYEDIMSDDYYRIFDYEFDLSYLRINNLFRYKMPMGSSYIFANAGMSNGFALKSSSNVTETKRIFADETVTNEPVFEDLRKYELGYILGIGVISHNFSLELRTSRGNGLSPFEALKSSTISYSILTSYRF